MSTPLIQDAVIHQIQIIGEAASRLSAEFRARSAAITWQDIVGMRQKLVHDYMGVDLESGKPPLETSQHSKLDFKNSPRARRLPSSPLHHRYVVISALVV